MMPSIFRKRHETEEITPIPGPLEAEASGIDKLQHLQQFEKMHKLDPNMPLDELSDVDAAIATGNAEKGLEIEHALMEDNSPYPEVRAVVRNYDVDVPANTVRAWVIGLLLCTIGSGVNMLFSLRNPSVAITTYVIQLVAYPLGLGWDMIMPDREWNLLGLRFNLRPGKFNFKEHVVIVAMSNVSDTCPLTFTWVFGLINVSRLPMVVAPCTQRTSCLPSVCSTSRTLAGLSRCSLELPRFALDMASPVWRVASLSGPPL